ncbi:MAG: hypothetical protein EOO59_06710, partial [Hymenobacter sp.]
MSASLEHLLIFAREPVLGRVKTRLAAGIGPVAALATYRELLALTARAVAAAQVPATVWLAEAPAAPACPGACSRPPTRSASECATPLPRLLRLAGGAWSS